MLRKDCVVRLLYVFFIQQGKATVINIAPLVAGVLLSTHTGSWTPEQDGSMISLIDLAIITQKMMSLLNELIKRHQSHSKSDKDNLE